MTDKKILVTSALPYVNNEPHLGNIVGCVLPADIYARFLKQQGKEVLYICGADEYGTCTEVKAREEGISEREVCDRYMKIHQDIYGWFGIDFSYFGRTSTTDPFKDLDWSQTTISQDIFRKLADNGYLVERETKQLFCPETNTFMADRFVLGTCPKCGFDRAKGDQCDKCNAVYQATELINPRPKLNSQHHLEIRSTTHLYLDLPTLEPQIRKWYDSVKDRWTENSRSITEAWFKEGLKERCVTRDLKWGTPVPDTKMYGDKYKNKVMYNWFDAPIGYLSITEQSGEDWRSWWLNPDQVELVQFFGVDNTVFHSVIFPASLIGTGDSYKLVDRINAVFYLNYENQKFSKSESIGVFGTGAIGSGIPSDVWRYYLMLQRPETRDAEFTWTDLESKVNGELINNLGNFINRVLAFTHKKFDKKIPKLTTLEPIDETFVQQVNLLGTKYMEMMDNISLKGGLETILAISHLCNKYMFDTEPWSKIKTDLTRCESIVHILIHSVSYLARLMAPFMPYTSNLLNKILRYSYPSNVFTLELLSGEIEEPVILFQKLTSDQIKDMKTRFG